MENIDIKIDNYHDIDDIIRFNLFKYNKENCDYIKNNSSYAHNHKKCFNIGLFLDDICIGGALGMIYFNWYHLSDFWIDEKYRNKGLGSKIMEEIEKIVKENNALGIKVDSWDYQAPSFYEKLGYKKWAEFKDCPPGTIHYYFYKKIN